jgi:hypothetical protein
MLPLQAMRVMNKRMNLPNMQKILMEFEKQNERMEMTSDMMGDAIDDAMEVGWACVVLRGALGRGVGVVRWGWDCDELAGHGGETVFTVSRHMLDKLAGPQVGHTTAAHNKHTWLVALRPSPPCVQYHVAGQARRCVSCFGRAPPCRRQYAV